MGGEVGQPGSMAAMSAGRSSPADGSPAGPVAARLDQQRPGAVQVPDDPGRVAADVVDVRGGDLDQALEEGPLGEVGVPIQAGSSSSWASKKSPRS